MLLLLLILLSISAVSHGSLRQFEQRGSDHLWAASRRKQTARLWCRRAATSLPTSPNCNMNLSNTTAPANALESPLASLRPRSCALPIDEDCEYSHLL